MNAERIIWMLSLNGIEPAYRPLLEQAKQIPTKELEGISPYRLAAMARSIYRQRTSEILRTLGSVL